MHAILTEIAERHTGEPLPWALQEEATSAHPEGGLAFTRRYAAGAVQLDERMIAGEGNPRDGWGWSYYFVLKLAGPELAILGGSYDRQVDPTQPWIRFATPQQEQALKAWLAAASA